MPHLLARNAADGWVQTFARIEGGDITTADRIVDIVLKEASINLACHYMGPMTDFISIMQVEEVLRQQNKVRLSARPRWCNSGLLVDESVDHHTGNNVVHKISALCPSPNTV